MGKKRGLGARSQATFLAALLEIGTIAGAARAADVDRPAVYATMRLDDAFAKAVDEARALGIEALKDEAYSRAMGWRGRASDILLMFLIKQSDPSYRDNYHAPEDEGDKVSLRDVMNAIRPEVSE